MPSAALERHPATPCAALRGVAVSIERSSEGLRVVYVLDGEVERLRIPPPRPPRAADGLWRHTCCELFVARAGEAGYREFNFSPSGEWAAYDFKRYREGGPLPLALEVRLKRHAHRLELASAVPAQSGALRIGASAVVEDANGALSYWALAHAPGKPDFHHPDAFALELG